MNRYALLLALVLPGCGGPARFDGTNETTTEDSIERMSAGMSKAEKERFTGDCATVLMIEGMRRAFKNFSKDAPTAKAEVGKPLHGKTVAEIHHAAEALRAEINAKQAQR